MGSDGPTKCSFICLKVSALECVWWATAASSAAFLWEHHGVETCVSMKATRGFICIAVSNTREWDGWKLSKLHPWRGEYYFNAELLTYIFAFRPIHVSVTGSIGCVTFSSGEYRWDKKKRAKKWLFLRRFELVKTRNPSDIFKCQSVCVA